MKRILLYFLVMFFTFFSGFLVVDAETIDMSDEGYVFVKEGDTICGLNPYSYSYVTRVYDYDENSGNDFVMVGNLGYSYYNSQSDYCFDVDFTSLYNSGLEKFAVDSFVFINSNYIYGNNPRIYPYYSPKISIDCDKSNIKYGEISECSLSYETFNVFDVANSNSSDVFLKPNCISELNFNFSNNNFKITDYSSDFHLKKTDNNYSIIDTSGTCSCDEKNVMLRFTVTPVNEEVVGTDLKISADNLSFVDSGSVSSEIDVSTNLGVSKDIIKNPETFSNIEVYIAVLIVIISLIGIYFLSKKLNMKKID